MGTALQQKIYEASCDLPEIIRLWMAQLADEDVVNMVQNYGGRRRLNVTLFSDREHVNRPPRQEVV
jgi:hypothetical protein